MKILKYKYLNIELEVKMSQIFIWKPLSTAEWANMMAFEAIRPLMEELHC